ncbi:MULTISPECIES: HlyD family secretion protein [Alphaproteobacteria]|uniref:Secretion protein HlyD n=2 Tax=Alphaproteobacteria TaxID=28211 RepID=A0A512HKS2_9HYPH|nr:MULTISPECIES: HlyD family efflux transporter periplasmic adaptor subunit [Alphaproteobacteria]GEO86047.1 secretion protein HlyD [Ciceribacter naphthalenivorans]GLR22134.1 secretion protein HlyD [Ciceribacter naphthalenivorans]GLT04990.1 secretion protein HlyD [Sphingomonas psychrolutea]
MKRVVLLVVVIAAVLFALPIYLNGHAERPYQGWVEADLLFIGPETTGRLATVTIAEGDPVERGKLLFRLEETSAQAAVAAKEANLAALQSQYDLATAAQKRPEEIEILQASQRQAEAQLSLSVQELDRTRALARNGTATRANLDAAIATEAANRAALDNIRGQVALAGLPARAEAIRQADQTMAAARAELASARDALSRLSVKAPAAGSVQTLYYKAGEVVPAGRPVVALLAPDAVRIRFFVAETEIAKIGIGQTVHVACDGCAPMDASVSFISAKAEYTPPEIYSLEERAKLVYRVEAIPQQPGKLRVGIPVDVTVASPGESK